MQCTRQNIKLYKLRNAEEYQPVEDFIGAGCGLGKGKKDRQEFVKGFKRVGF